MTAGQLGQHSAPRTGLWARRRVPAIAGAVVLLAGGATAYALTRGPSAAERQAHAAAAARARAAAQEAVLRSDQTQLLDGISITPAPGATNVPLDTPVTVSMRSGTVLSVKVVTAAGVALAGALSSTAGDWVSSGGLLPSTTYTLTVTVGGNGVTASRTSTFSTLTPTVTVTASVFPSNGLTVGVGQPVVLRFDHDVASPATQKAIESRLTVAMSSPVPGAWYWFSEHELHFHPQAFWPAHETIRVSGDLTGINLGNGEWTGGSILDTFGIGDARISYANLSTERMVVTLDGKTMYTFPISGGRPQYPTMNGIHLVLDRESVVHMVSSTVGIPVHSPNGYDEYVYDDVHISDSGEYVHAAPWSVGAQGVTNVSHGCINLSSDRALTFYNFSRVGDVVEVTGGPRAPVWGDHGVMDWSGPAWSQWTPGTVVALSPSDVPSTTSTTPTTITQPVPVTSPAPASTVPSTTTTVARTTTTSHPAATTTAATTVATAGST